MKVDIICKTCDTKFRGDAISHGSPRRFCSPECGWEDRKTHGGSQTVEFNIWQHIRARCNRPSHKAYADYGGRGIKVCERWDIVPGGFENFLADMGIRPGRQFTLDRINNDLGYSLDNCRWATRLEQNRNRRISYTPAEDRIIRRSVRRGLNFRQIGELIGKSSSAVANHAYRIGLKSGQPVPAPRKFNSARAGLAVSGKE